MGLVDSLRGRDASADAPGSTSAGGRDAEDPILEELRRRRDELQERVSELHWDLGGLAYEMAIRDHFRLDLLVRRAADLQSCDAELDELEHALDLASHSNE